jgi:uncharacterized protein (TIGR01244 family)
MKSGTTIQRDYGQEAYPDGARHSPYLEEQRMLERIQITEMLSAGAQPTEQHLRDLAAQGVRSIVNLRLDDEEDQPLSPMKEGELVKALGMEYRHIPVSKENMTPELVDKFRAELTRIQEPVFVHCHKKTRAGALTMMHQAIESGLSGDEALEQARAIGFECNHPELERFFSSYIDSRSRAYDSREESFGAPEAFPRS